MDSMVSWTNDTGDMPDLIVNDYEIPLLGAFLFYFVQCLYGTVFVVGLMGNTLVIYVVLRYTKMQTVTNLYILNLAVADECFLIGIPFIMTTMGLGYWPFGNVMCKIYMTTTSVNQFTSSLLLTVMSADRYIAVCHPIDAATVRTPFYAKVVSTTTWGISFLMIVPIFLYAHTQQVHSDWAIGSTNDSGVVDTLYWSNGSATTITSWITNNTLAMSSILTGSGLEDGTEIHPASPIVSCNIYWPENEYMNGQAAFTLYTFTLAFAIPLILILVFYILVIRKLKTVGPTNKSKEKRRSHRKVTRLVLTVVTVYVLCWLPYWVSQVSLIFTPPKASQSPYIVAIFLLAGCLGYSNSAVNPILYAFLSDNFKKSFMKACTCAERMEVNKALAGENSVFTRRGRNSERTFGHNDSLRSRVPPVPGGPTGRSYGPQGTIELPNPILATIQQEMCVSFVNRSDDECCNGSPEREIPDVANGSLKMDEPFTNGRNSTNLDVFFNTELILIGTFAASSGTPEPAFPPAERVGHANGSSHVLHSDL
ncbi:somatostatin receptor type 5-like [Daphnia pulicaria]|uniref:somatostatin receptor type 5-like n=1 Tax=Daphnia pulicaria TaxID=35523 RepID=UPI001EEC2BD6|nr:somatostatin receptor type 5-like [Daphnia pulicaria]